MSWWAPRSSKPLSGSHCRWWVRFPSASATCGFALYGAHRRWPLTGQMISACHSRATSFGELVKRGSVGAGWQGGRVIPETRHDATGERIIKALQEAALGADQVAGSVAGQSASVVQHSFLAWAETAETQLRNVFVAPAVAEMLWTERFWGIARSDRATPRLIQTILAEVQDRSRYFESLREWATQQIQRWQSPVRTLVIPDTNVLLAPDGAWLSIDWAGAAEGQVGVRLIVPIVVVYELDRLKRTGTKETRTAARGALRWLTNNFTFRSLHERVALPDLVDTSVEILVDDGPARRDDPDGEIIGVTSTLRQLGQVPTKLATYDLGMRLRAISRGVDVVQLPDRQN